MPDDFDPYYQWLGIPPEEQSPNLYRLLAIPLFEENIEVIEKAGNARMGLLRSFQMGKRSELSQEILNEVTAAKLCLLNQSEKKKYDEQLHRQLAGEDVVVSVEPPPLDFNPPSLSISNDVPFHIPAANTLRNAAVLIAFASLGVVALLAFLWWPEQLGKELGSRPLATRSEPLARSRPIKQPLFGPSGTGHPSPASQTKKGDNSSSTHTQIESKAIKPPTPTTSPVETKPVLEPVPSSPKSPSGEMSKEPENQEEPEGQKGEENPFASPSGSNNRSTTNGSSTPEAGSLSRSPENRASGDNVQSENNSPAPSEFMSQPASQQAARSKPPAPVSFLRGKWVRLFPIIDTDRDSVEGSWILAKSSLRTDKAASMAKVMLPVKVEGNYDLDVEFTWISGTQQLAIIIPIASRQCVLLFRSNRVSLETIHNSQSTTTAMLRTRGFASGKPCAVHLQVRIRQDNVVIFALLNRKYRLGCSCKLSDFDVPYSWRLPESGRPGLGYSGEAIFHSVKIRRGSGKLSTIKLVTGPAESQVLPE